MSKKKQIESSDEEYEESSSLYRVKRRKYKQIDFNKRQQLLLKIDEGRTSIKSASSMLGINYSTAKNIVKIYRREDRIEKLPKHPQKSHNSDSKV